ncbi:putative glucuronosyltransferase PGSIP8 isoform X2, partial [Tanacetum coccineum]
MGIRLKDVARTFGLRIRIRGDIMSGVENGTITVVKVIIGDGMGGCAVFINPCIFHTGLFVLEPSSTVFKDMLHDLELGRDNSDGADQGFIGGCFPDLLDQPLFHPPPNGTKLNGTFRLPLGYQMDAMLHII